MKAKQNESSAPAVVAVENVTSVTNYLDFAGRGVKVITGAVMDGAGNVVEIAQVGEKETSQGKRYALYTVNGGDVQFNSPELKSALAVGIYNKVCRRNYSASEIKVMSRESIKPNYDAMQARYSDTFASLRAKAERLAGICGANSDAVSNWLLSAEAIFTLPTFEVYSEMQEKLIAENEAKAAKQKEEEEARRKEKEARAIENALKYITDATLRATLTAQLAALRG